MAGRRGNLGAALDRQRLRRAHRCRPRACSTSATATAPPTRPCCNTRSAWRCCPTAAWPIADTYNGGDSPLRPGNRRGVARWPPISPSRPARAIAGRRAGGRRLRGAPPGTAGATGGFGPAGRRRRGTRCAGRRRTSAPASVELAVVFTPPPGQKLDDRYGPSTRLEITSSPPGLLVRGRGRRHRPDPEAGAGGRASPRACCTSSRRRRAATTDGVEHPACHLVRQDWGVPVTRRARAVRRGWRWYGRRRTTRSSVRCAGAPTPSSRSRCCTTACSCSSRRRKGSAEQRRHRHPGHRTGRAAARVG